MMSVDDASAQSSAPDLDAEAPPERRGMSIVAFGGLASIAAGAIHASAAGIHAEHAQLARIFIVAAVLQIGVGLWALGRPAKPAAWAVVVVNAVFALGWLATRLFGIAWIDGLEVREAPQFADVAAAVLALIAVVAANAGALLPADRQRKAGLMAPVALICVVAVAAMFAASTHAHSGGSAHGTGTADADHGHGDEPAAGAEADVVVVVVGYTPIDEGEEYYIAGGGDRDSLNLPEGQVEFVEQVLALDKPTVIVIETGSVVNLPWLSNENQKQATVWAGYSGQLGGRALGRLLFGQANFSGKLAFTWPTEHELRSFKDSDSESTAHYLFGYRDYDHRKYVEGLEVDLIYPFGHGLSYASFRYSNLVVPCTTMAREAVFRVTVDIENDSQADGDEVALLFVKPPPRLPGLQGERPHKQLLSFTKVFVPAGKTATVHLPVRIQDLRRWEGGTDGRWVIDPGQYTVVVAPNAEAAETSPLSATFVVAED